MNLHSEPMIVNITDLQGVPWVAANTVDEETGEITASIISEIRVREVITSIRQDIASARQKLYFLWENQAWEVLGYSSWHDLLSSEFSEHHSYLRRMTQAAQIEANVGVDIGTHKESHLRAIYEVLKDEELQQQAYWAALDVDAETAQDYRKVAWVVHVNAYAPDRIKQRLKDGLLSPAQAYGLTIVLQDTNNKAVHDIVSRCSDPKLAMMIVKLSEKSGETFQEIVLSGTIPALPDPIPLHEATASNLRAWLDLSSAEHRAAAVETNRDRYQRAEEALSTFVSSVRRLLYVVGKDQEPLVTEIVFDCEKKLEDYLNAKKAAADRETS